MLNYTYKHDIEGGGTSHYVKLVFDRQVSPQDTYRGKFWLGYGQKPEVTELLGAAAQTPNVIRDNTDGATHCQLIHVSGCNMEVKICLPTQGRGVSEIANQIAKKIQRRLARGEGRRRLTFKKVEANLLAAERSDLGRRVRLDNPKGFVKLTSMKTIRLGVAFVAQVTDEVAEQIDQNPDAFFVELPLVAMTLHRTNEEGRIAVVCDTKFIEHETTNIEVWSD